MFLPLRNPARYKGSHGGRGSGKSHDRGEALIERAYFTDMRAVCVREIQNTMKDSVHQLLVDKIQKFNMGTAFNVAERQITGPKGSQIIFRGMQDATAENIKSLEGFDLAWWEEAQTAKQKSLDLLRPTIRKPLSELWFSWNPRSEFDPVDILLRGANVPKGAIVVRANHNDNPWFPDVLRDEMELDRVTDAEKARHIWDGDYQQAPKGAYYAALLANAKTEGRTGRVPHNPALPVHVSFDLGSGRNQALWFTQRVGRTVLVIDYLEGTDEAADEGYSWYARKMKEGHRSKYAYATLTFPHDGRVREATGKSRAETMESHGFKVEVLPILPVDDGIDAVKLLLPMCWIDEEKCADGLVPLTAYRENYDDKLRRSNGPLKDWTNHAADSFRYTAVAYQAPRAKRPANTGGGSGGWMG